jgi:hypothetical protein
VVSNALLCQSRWRPVCNQMALSYPPLKSQTFFQEGEGSMTDSDVHNTHRHRKPQSACLLSTQLFPTPPLPSSSSSCPLWCC